MKIKSVYQPPSCDVIHVSMWSILQAPSDGNVYVEDLEDVDWSETDPEGGY